MIASSFRRIFLIEPQAAVETTAKLFKAVSVRSRLIAIPGDGPQIFHGDPAKLGSTPGTRDAAQASVADSSKHQKRHDGHNAPPPNWTDEKKSKRNACETAAPFDAQSLFLEVLAQCHFGARVYRFVDAALAFSQLGAAA